MDTGKDCVKKLQNFRLLMIYEILLDWFKTQEGCYRNPVCLVGKIIKTYTCREGYLS